MRNLKKILALVLALIMSLSLMATAGATDFSDADQITDDYAESVDVLDNLKVFQGYPSGDFQPQGEIKRSEVAVIIYRIATGDVDDSQVSIYKDYNKFSDVTSSHWAAGYINYCANAEYIKGRNAKTFDPEGKVTGYEALAMILRAVGYDKQGEFTGSNWHIQTAATGKQLGVTDKINSDIMLKQPATREMVAEILCKSILVPTVEYTAAFGYRDYTGSNTADKNESLGYKTFGLEYIEGVVTGNEFADLETEESAMDAGYSRIARFDGEKDITLRVKSHFGDIGESRRAYIVPVDSRNKSEHKMACSQLWPTTDNVVSASGDSTSPSSLAGKENIRLTDATEYFINYDRTNIQWEADRRVSYLIALSSLTADERDYLDDLAAAANGNTTLTDSDGDGVADSYFRWIAPNTVIPATDRDIIIKIFRSADKQGTNPANGAIAATIIRGEVYVGTESIHDVSDVMSLAEFVSTYIDDELVNITGNGNGNYLKVIDNNDDGIVDYVLLTHYTLDDVAGVTSTGSVVYRTMPAGSTVKFEDGEYKYDEYADYDADVTPAMGDVVIWAAIDGAYYAHVVSPETATIKNVHFDNVTVTDTNDNTYNQSAVTNGTAMEGDILKMSELVEYTIYRDLFGHLRAYKTPNSRYALLTEMYPTSQYNTNYVRNIPWITEMMTPADNYPVEYSVLNAYPNGTENVFIDDPELSANIGVLAGRNDYLQEAIARLGINCKATSSQYGIGTNTEFTWHDGRQSTTNVAKYTKAENGVSLYTASEISEGWFYGWIDTNNNNVVDIGDIVYDDVDTRTVVTAANLARYNEPGFKGIKMTTADWQRAARTRAVLAADLPNFEPVFAVDYIRLAVENVTAGMRQYTIADYIRAKVDATNTTDFYIVGANNSIRHVTGYAAVTAIPAENIRAAYAVASNTNWNSDGFDYWVADVIVIELGDDFAFDAIDLTYSNPQQTTAEIKQIKALDNEAESVIETLYPTGYNWGVQNSFNGFWGRTNSATYEDGVSGYLHRIGPKTANAVFDTADWVSYNNNGIYAGVVVDFNGVYTPGGYIAVNMEGSFDGTSSSAETSHSTTVTTWFNGKAVPVYAISSNGSAYELRAIDKSGNSQMNAGDSIIWVYDNAKQEVAYIVNVSYGTTAAPAAGWLATEWNNIIAEQTHAGHGLEPTFLSWGNNAQFAGQDIDQAITRDATGKILGDSIIALDYSDALEGFRKESSIVMSAGHNQAIQSVTYQTNTWKGVKTAVPTTGWSAIASGNVDISKRTATIPVDAADMKSDEHKIWRVTVTVTTNGITSAETFDLVRYADHRFDTNPVTPAALTTGTPYQATLANGNLVAVNPDNTITYPTGTQINILDFLRCFQAPYKGSIVWTFTDGLGKQYSVIADRYSHLTGEYENLDNLPVDRGFTLDFESIVATVLNEDETTSPEQVYTWVNTTKIPDGTNYIVVVPDPKDPNTENVAEIVITENAGKYTIVVTMLNGAHPYLHQVQTNPALRAAVANGWTVVEGWHESPAGTWTIVIKADPYSQFIVNSDSTGSDPNPPSTSVEVKKNLVVAVDETGKITVTPEQTSVKYYVVDDATAIDAWEKDQKVPAEWTALTEAEVALEGEDSAVGKYVVAVVEDANGYVTNAGISAQITETGAETPEYTVTDVSVTDKDGNAIEGCSGTFENGTITLDLTADYKFVSGALSDGTELKINGDGKTITVDTSKLTENVTANIIVEKTETPVTPDRPVGLPDSSKVDSTHVVTINWYADPVTEKDAKNPSADYVVAELARAGITGGKLTNAGETALKSTTTTATNVASAVIDADNQLWTLTVNQYYKVTVHSSLVAADDTTKVGYIKAGDSTVKIADVKNGDAFIAMDAGIAANADTKKSAANGEITIGAQTADVEYVSAVKMLIQTAANSNIKSASAIVGGEAKVDFDLHDTTPQFVAVGLKLNLTGTATSNYAQLTVNGKGVGTPAKGDGATDAKYSYVVSMSDYAAVSPDNLTIAETAGYQVKLGSTALGVFAAAGDAYVDFDCKDQAFIPVTGTNGAVMLTNANGVVTGDYAIVDKEVKNVIGITTNLLSDNYADAGVIVLAKAVGITVDSDDVPGAAISYKDEAAGVTVTDKAVGTSTPDKQYVPQGATLTVTSAAPKYAVITDADGNTLASGADGTVNQNGKNKVTYTMGTTEVANVTEIERIFAISLTAEKTNGKKASELKTAMETALSGANFDETGITFTVKADDGSVLADDDTIATGSTYTVVVSGIEAATGYDIVLTEAALAALEDQTDITGAESFALSAENGKLTITYTITV